MLQENINNQKLLNYNEFSDEDFSIYEILWSSYRKNQNFEQVAKDCGIINVDFLIQEFKRLNQEYFMLDDLRKNQNQTRILELILEHLIIRNDIEYIDEIKELVGKDELFEYARVVERVVYYLIRLNQTGITLKEILLTQYDLTVSDKLVNLFNENILELKMNYLMNMLNKS